MSEKGKKWYLGLDIGTNSVGFCATDTEYNILTKNHKLQCGSRLFEDAKDASERRLYRANRRRMARRKERINLLREFFEEAVCKIDPSFFIRLKESNYHLEDKSEKSKYPLFNDPNYKDADFYNQYPTIYHLREALIAGDVSDPRLLYLACHHLIKYRGHFLFDSFNSESSGNVKEIVESINSDLDDLKDILGAEDFGQLSLTDVDLIEYVIRKKKLPSKKQSEDTAPAMAAGGQRPEEEKLSNARQFEVIASLLNPQKDRTLKKLLEAMSGKKIEIKILVDDDLYESIQNDESVDLKDFKFGSEKYEEILEALGQYLNDTQLSLLQHLKEFYDLVCLNRILGGYQRISEAMVARYRKHHDDLTLFKRFIKNHCPEKYNEIFRRNYSYPDKSKKSDVSNASYQNYVGSNMTRSKREKSYCISCVTKPSSKRPNTKAVTATYQNFLQYVKNILADLVKAERVTETDKDYVAIKNSVDNEDFCKIQNLDENSYIPYQLTLKELSQILERQQKNFEFLTGENIEKIKSILTFRIPYFVGPLSELHEGKFAWVVKNPGFEKQKVLPWNFKEIVDRQKTGEKFIRRMTSRCTYLRGEDVLPKQSLLYQKYMVLNELNNISINGNRIDPRSKEILYKEFCLKGIKLSKAKIEQKLKEHFLNDSIEVTSKIDFQSSLSSLVKFKSVLGENIDEKMCEDIIFWNTVFSEGKSPVREKIKEKYGDRLEESQIERLAKFDFKGWGRFSEKFLSGIGVTDRTTGESALSIIDLLENTTQNLVEVLNNEKYKPGFLKLVDEENKGDENEEVNYSYVENLYCSPTVKRSIWQAIKISRELAEINDCPPAKIFVEVTRGEEPSKKGKVTDSRRKKIEDLYRQVHPAKVLEESFLRNLRGEFDRKTDPREFRGDRLYLYFMQLGRCIYSGEKIDLDELYDKNLYDIDHIYPQSLIKDDSLDNRVLVRRNLNQTKKNIYPIDPEIRNNRREFWRFLRDKKFISEEKYKRLISSEPLTPEIIGGFINRQLVSTNIAVKETIGALNLLFGEDETTSPRIVYSKAARVSEFRHMFDLVKCRTINNLHHGHDAYLNIVVGNVWDGVHSIYRKSGNNQDLDLDKLFKRDRPGLWNKNFISKIEKYIFDNKKYLNKFVVTQRPFECKGKFYDQTIYPKGFADMPMHSTQPYGVSKGGGYKNKYTSYVCAVEYADKHNRRKADLFPVYVKDRAKALKNLNVLIEENFHLEDPTVTYRCIPMFSLLEIEGIRYCLRGRSDVLQLTVMNEWQPNKEVVQIIHDMDSYAKLVKNKEIKEPDDSLQEYEFAVGKIISKNKNQIVFDAIMQQIKKPMYREYPFRKKLNENKLKCDRFVEASLSSQIKLIFGLLNFVTLNGTLCNAKLIGGVDNEVCKFRVSSLSDKNVYLISQSVTGLFEKRIKII